MKKLVLGLTAAAAIALTAAPALAQVEFYAGPGGIGVGVSGPYYGNYGYYGRPYGYYNYAPGWRGHRHYYHHRHY
jgi:hypothetical protein